MLFEQGDTPDALYALVSGAVGISATDATGAIRRIARIAPPDTIGEMALLSERPRSATATVLRDSFLMRLSRESFAGFVDENPKAMLYFARLLADRLRDTIGTRGRVDAVSTFAVVALTDGIATGRLAEAVARAMGPGTGLLAAWPADADETWFHRFESRHERVVYAADALNSPWSNVCLRRADHVLLLARAGEPPVAGLSMVSGRSTSWQRRDLLAIQDAVAMQPAALHPEIAALPVSLRLQLREGHQADVERTARVVTGRGLGVVLSGGGARGFAHLGVLRALGEAGHVFDLVGGTSIGAVVAAGFGMGWDVGEISDRVVDAFVSSSPLNDYTFPVVALTGGRKVDQRLARHFGDAAIEDLWLPFFCVSSNLTLGQPHLHRAGALVQALRASIAIPGLLPPVPTPEGLLVDGAVMNNLPADIMAGLGRGPVIAVDVAGDAAFQAPSTHGWLGTILRGLFQVDPAMPNIAQILLRSGTVSSEAQSQLARARAAAVILPPLADVDLRDWRAYDRVVDLGYRHTRMLIDQGAFAVLEAART